MISIFDMFKIGIGPSSLHTVGLMRAGILFRKQLIKQGLLDKIARFSAHVYGSLSFTGKNHGIDHTIIGSLAGYEPDTVDTTASPEFIAQVLHGETLTDIGGHYTPFDYERDFMFHSSFRYTKTACAWKPMSAMSWWRRKWFTPSAAVL